MKINNLDISVTMKRINTFYIQGLSNKIMKLFSQFYLLGPMVKISYEHIICLLQYQFIHYAI